MIYSVCIALLDCNASNSFIFADLPGFIFQLPLDVDAGVSGYFQCFVVAVVCGCLWLFVVVFICFKLSLKKSKQW